MPSAPYADHQASQLDILIPHHANPSGLEKTLASVAEQSWSRDPGCRLRVIIVDDGSSEADFAAVNTICTGFLHQSGQALLLERLVDNQGRPFVRNRLLELAQAPYLAWLDAGDIWYRDKLAVQFAHLAECIAAGDDPDDLWVSCAYDWEQDGQRVARRQRIAGNQFAALLEGDHLRGYLWTMLATRQAFARAGRFDPDLPRLQDLDYCLAFLCAGGRITVPSDPAPLCCYVKSKLGRDARQVAAGHMQILKRHGARLADYPRAFRAQLYARGPVLAARFALANSAYALALRYLLAAVWASPKHALRFAAHAVTRRLQRILPLAQTSAGAGR